MSRMWWQTKCVCLFHGLSMKMIQSCLHDHKNINHQSIYMMWIQHKYLITLNQKHEMSMPSASSVLAHWQREQSVFDFIDIILSYFGDSFIMNGYRVSWIWLQQLQYSCNTFNSSVCFILINYTLLFCHPLHKHGCEVCRWHYGSGSYFRQQWDSLQKGDPAPGIVVFSQQTRHEHQEDQGGHCGL